MEIVTEDGIEIFCLPDCARCKLTGKSPTEMIECPEHCFDVFGDVCRPDDCDYYEENWEAKEE